MKTNPRVVVGLAACLLAMPAVTQAQFLCATNNGTITITGYTGSGGAVVIPATVGGLPVTRIGNSAFKGCWSLTSVVIPNGVTTIEDNAFYECVYVTRFTLPDTLKHIGNYAFYSCMYLNDIAIPSGVESMGRLVFSTCSELRGLEIPNTVTNLGIYAFQYCYALNTVTLSTNLTSIPNGTFSYCQRLKQIVIPVGVTRIGRTAFYHCEQLTNLIIPDQVASIDEYACYECYNLTNVVVGSGVTSIGKEMFQGSSSLQGVYFKGAPPALGTGVFDVGSTATVYYVEGTLGWGTSFGGMATAPWILFDYTVAGGEVTLTHYNGFGGMVFIPAAIGGLPVTAIGDWASALRNDIVGLVIPGSVRTIGYGAFASCQGLVSVTLGEGVESIADYAFNTTPLSTLSIPASVTSIKGSAFTWCLYLSSFVVDDANPVYSSVDGVLFNKEQTQLIAYPEGKKGGYTIPATVGEIGEYAFFMSALTSIAFPGSVTNIGNSAFSSCHSMSSIDLGNGVVRIGEGAFNQCDQMISVTIPRGVIDLGTGAFGACSSLTDIVVDPLNSVYSSLDGVLFDKDRTVLLQCPKGKPGTYAVPVGVERIAEYAFLNVLGVTNVFFPSGVTNIGYGAFWLAWGPRSVTFSEGLDRIEDCAFFLCPNLVSVEIPASVTRIGEHAFYGCDQLRSVTLGGATPASIQPMGALPMAFLASSGIIIGPGAFGNCPNLAAIHVDNQNPDYSSVDGVLFDKAKTTLIQCPGGREGLYSVPDGVAGLANASFEGCPNLTRLTLPSSLSMIGDAAFVGCTRLGGIYFQGDPPSLVGSDVFSNAPNATVYYLTDDVNWGASFAGHPTAVWTPEILSGGFPAGSGGDTFAIDLFWSRGMDVVVEACERLDAPEWHPIQTMTLTEDLTSVSDPDATEHPQRFYQVRKP